MTREEIQARGQRTVERLRRANGEYAEQLEQELAWLDLLLTFMALNPTVASLTPEVHQ